MTRLVKDAFMMELVDVTEVLRRDMSVTRLVKDAFTMELVDVTDALRRDMSVTRLVKDAPMHSVEKRYCSMLQRTCSAALCL